MSYVGSSAAVIPVAFSGVNSQSFNGNGSTVAFTLNRPVSAVNAIEVMVNNVQQSPYDSSYSVSSTTLTFSAAPSTGTANIYVVYRDFPVGSITDPNTYTKAQADALLADRVAKTGDTMTGNLSVTNSSSTTPTGYFQNTSGSGDSPALIARGGANNTNTVGTFEVQSYGGNKQLKVDGNGRVTMPYQPVMYLNGNDGSTIAGPAIMVNFTVEIQKGGMTWNGANGRITVPVAGYYRIDLKCYHYAPTVRTSIYINNVQRSLAHSAGAANDQTRMQYVIALLAANDYIYFSHDAAIYMGPNHTQASCYLIG
tara:strand:- start:64 stop:996 length:933 start_codon:yes stop_codon:yes gene_type:complete